VTHGEIAALIERHRRFSLRDPFDRPLLNLNRMADETTDEEPMVLPSADGSLAGEGMELFPHVLSADLPKSEIPNHRRFP